MARNAETPSVQLVDGQGNFNHAELESFVRTVKLAECGLSYAVVAIMGPQSSGKSTLMNHLFHTSFREMDAYRGRFQTTQGIWLAKAVGIDPCTLVMDLEGTDGRERGEDDTAFERQSSLFALAVADIVLINMWCHDIGREHAANKPLLKTVFQVMMRLFTPRKTTLLFVIRDKTKTPFEILEPILREDIQKIWESVAKPSKYTETPLSEFFNVQVTALSSFEEKEEEFKEQVSLLRQQFYNSIAPGGLAGDRRTVIPGSGFPLSAQEIWKVIKENKDLDLPAHKIMVATVRCDEIANEKFHELISDEEWQNLLEGTKIAPVAGFGKMMNGLLDKCLSGYDAEAAYFESSVRDAKRASLLGRCLEAAQPMYQAVLGHYRVKAFEKFKSDLARSAKERYKGFADTVRHCTEESLNEFDEGCHDAHIKLAQWDITKIREKLCRDIDAHTSVTRAEKLSKITSGFEHHLEETLTASAASLLDSASSDTWAAMIKLLCHEVEVAEANFLSAISGFELKETEQDKMVARLRDFGREIVLKKAREEAGQVLIRMKDRFNTIFTRDADSMPRIWSAEHDVREITKDARIASLKLLAVLAAVRLEDGNSVDIETTLMTLIGELSEFPQEASVNTTATDNRSLLSSASSALASSTWDGVLPEYTLITPIECRSIWRQFKAETEYTISQALAAQEASKRGASWLPPPWAIVAMIFLGFNEFMAVVRNPIYLIVVFVLYLVGKALWVQLDIRKEFEHGMLTGLISVSTKLLPTFMNIMKRLVDEGHQHGREDDAVRGRPIPLQDFSSDLSTTDMSLNGPQSVSQGVRQRQTNTAFQT